MKDVESVRPKEIHIAAVRPRGDVRDRIVGAESIDELKQGAVVGTSSPRRAAQVRRLRPDLKIVPIRGNVETRLKRVENRARSMRHCSPRPGSSGSISPRALPSDRNHPPRAGPGGDRDGMPQPTTPPPERTDHGQQPDHLSVRHGRAGVHPRARRAPAIRRSRPSACSRTAIFGCAAAVQRRRQRHGRGRAAFEGGDNKPPEELARSLLAVAPNSIRRLFGA